MKHRGRGSSTKSSRSFVSAVSLSAFWCTFSARIHTWNPCFCFDLNARFVLWLFLTPFLVLKLFIEGKGPSTLVFCKLCGASSTAALNYAKECVTHLQWPVHTSNSQPCTLRCLSGILPDTFCLLPKTLSNFLVVWPVC